MSAPREKPIVNAVLKMLLKRGAFAYKVWGNPVQEKGIPDIICCYRGRFLAFELKRGPDEEATPYQQYQIGRITRAGGVARVIHSVPQAEALLDRIDRELGDSRQS